MDDVAVTTLQPLLRALIEEPPQPERLRSAAVEVLADVAKQLATDGIAMLHTASDGRASVLLAVESGGEALDLDGDWSEDDWDHAKCVALVARLTERAPDAPAVLASEGDALFVAFDRPQKPDGAAPEVWAGLSDAAGDGDWRPGPVARRWRDLLATLEPFGKALDENVQFTVYRPASMPAMTWQPVLAFAHLAEARELSDPDPLVEVRRQAEAALGADAARYRDTTTDSRAGVPRESDVTMRLELPGCEINPTERSFRWLEDVHREEFRLRARPQCAGSTLRGSLTVFVGCLLLADVPIAIAVVAEGAEAPLADNGATAAVASSAAPYRRVFASYSHDDAPVVRTIEVAIQAVGDTYLRDVKTLRAGEKWDPRLLELIEQADVFQLFWSNAAMRSPNVRREWEHALSLHRPGFVRPTFWESPFPEDPDAGLPPDRLRELHFHALPRDAVPTADDVSGDTTSPPPRPVARARRRLFAIGGAVASTVGAAALVAVLAGSGSLMTVGNAARDSLTQFSEEVDTLGPAGSPSPPTAPSLEPPVVAPNRVPISRRVTTDSAVAVTATQATLTGRIEARYARYRAYFEIGLTDAYDVEVRAILIGDRARATVDDLVSDSTYHYRLVVDDGRGAVHVGEDRFFTTRR